MDDRSTLERAFGHVWEAEDASRALIRLSEPDREVNAAIARAKAMLGQLLAEEAAHTPWTRWKAASCDLLNWCAARLMRALYIRPFRVCPQKVPTGIRLSQRENASDRHAEVSRPAEPRGALVEFQVERSLADLKDVQRWLTAKELVELRLCDLPTSTVKLHKLAAEQGWPRRMGVPKVGGGKCWYYDINSLPELALADLNARRLDAATIRSEVDQARASKSLSA